MKAVIYARYSSHKQNEESIEGQLRECYQFAEKNGFTVTHEYIDRAISGKTADRPSFQELIADSSKGKFEAVIMYTLDRFARNRYDSAMYKAKLKKNGVKLYYAKQPMPDTPEGIILESVLEGYAEYYSENLSRGVKRGMHEVALQGRVTGKAPLGYVADENKKYQIDPETAQAVKYIFQMYSEGITQREISLYLNSHGYRTATGRKFGKSSYHSILTNEKYMGVYRYGDVVIENCIPPIISKELFDKVQERMRCENHKGARNKAKETYLLSGKLYCGHCGKPMIGESGTSRHGNIYRYYKCSCRKADPKSCDKKPEKKEPLEDLIVRKTITRVFTDENIEIISDKVIDLLKEDLEQVSHVKQLENTLAETKNKIQNILTAIEQGIIVKSTLERLHELEKEKDEIESNLSIEKSRYSNLPTKNQIMFYLYSLKNGNVDNGHFRRQLVRSIINSIFVYDNPDGGKKIVVNFNLPNNEIDTLSLSDSDMNLLGAPSRDRCLGFFYFLLFEPNEPDGTKTATINNHLIM